MFVDTLFSVLNFAVLIALFTYIFYRVFYPQISAKIRAEQRMRAELEAERTDCAARLGAVEAERDTHEQRYRTLAHKVAEWKRVVAEQQEVAVREQEIRDEAVRARMQKQSAAFTAQRHWSQVMPRAVAQARLELYDHFQHNVAGRTYIEQVVAQVKRHHGNT
ncbi:MAG: hypothetical protein M1549_02880 [Candidatus Dependentiae bacterium]|nr:hypothetical protein [Candidatus Dependentiae bacterium]